MFDFFGKYPFLENSIELEMKKMFLTRSSDVYHILLDTYFSTIKREVYWNKETRANYKQWNLLEKSKTADREKLFWEKGISVYLDAADF